MNKYKPRYYDVRGKPITMEQWAIAFEYGSHIIRWTKVGRFVVSTIWLGLDHNFREGDPLIFETMVFPSEKNFNDLDSNRYSTFEEAKKGHEKMVKKWSKK